MDGRTGGPPGLFFGHENRVTRHRSLHETRVEKHGVWLIRVIPIPRGRDNQLVFLSLVNSQRVRRRRFKSV